MMRETVGSSRYTPLGSFVGVKLGSGSAPPF